MTIKEINKRRKEGIEVYGFGIISNVSSIYGKQYIQINRVEHIIEAVGKKLIDLLTTQWK